MKHLVYNILYCSIFILLCSCNKKEEVVEYGSLYGFVTDIATGQTIKSAGVELLPIGLKAITGADGQFEFTKVEAGTYQLLATKAGYKEYTTNNIVVKANNDDKPVNIQLEKLPPALLVVDNSGAEIDSVDFGEIEGDVLRSFNIFNNSEDSLEWEIVYVHDWIESFSKESGVLKAGATQAIVITIDRTKLQNGFNSTVAHIVSDNGSKQLVIMATSVPLVETLAVSEITQTSAVLNGKINKKSVSSIVEYGFVYGTMPTPTLENGATKVTINGTAQVGTFSAALSKLKEKTTYFVKAFASISEDVYYGETRSFVAEEMPYMEVTNKLMVQKQDLGYVDWYSAKIMCESSNVGGFSDWRMPTQEELMTLYTNKDKIGGFNGYVIPNWTGEIDYKYWGSDTRTGAGWTFGVYVDFSNGYVNDDFIAGTQSIGTHNIRAVRTIQ